jgi:hypothetical protein
MTSGSTVLTVNLVKRLNSPALWRIAAAALAVKNPSDQIGWQKTALLICERLDCPGR